MKHLSAKTRKRYFYLMVAIFLVAVPVLISYSLGYRISREGSIVRTGGIVIRNVPAEAKLWLNGEEAGSGSLLSDKLFIGGLMPGDYEVELLREGMAPWRKTLTVSERKANLQWAVLIPQPMVFKQVVTEPAGEKNEKTMVVVSNKEGEEIEKLFRPEAKLTPGPSLIFGKEAVVLRRFGPLEVVKLKGQLVAGWTGKDDELPKSFIDENGLPQRVFELGKISSPIIDVDFLPDRYELAILTLASGIYLTEINATPAYTLYPVYVQAGARTGVSDDGKLYILSGTKVFVLESKL